MYILSMIYILTYLKSKYTDRKIKLANFHIREFMESQYVQKFSTIFDRILVSFIMRP